MARKASNIADLFLCWAYQDGDLITNLKLQKLLYYAQGWYVAFFNKYLFEDEIEAWCYGPVVRSVYSEYAKFNHTPIKYVPNNKEEKNFSAKELQFLKDFYAKFIGYSAHHLVSSSHNEKPWKQAYEEGRKKTIKKEQIKKFFVAQLKK